MSIFSKLFKEKYKVTQLPNLREPSFEECVDEFIRNYYNISLLNPNKNDINYSTFIHMFCNEEEDIGSNYNEQEKLMDLVRKQGYTTAPQFSDDDRIIFIHIYRQDGFNENTNLDMVKLYINCDRKNISLLTNHILQKIRTTVGAKLYLKFISEQNSDCSEKPENNSFIKNYQRNDKIVIYAENPYNAEKIATKINELRSEHPELFSFDKTLPFIPKKYGFIGFASKKSTDFAQTPLGTAGGSTYNDYISDFLFFCIISGFDKYYGIDSLSNQDHLKERMIRYAKQYQTMGKSEKDIILCKIKEIFEQVSRENNVHTSYFTPVRKDDLVQNQ